MHHTPARTREHAATGHTNARAPEITEQKYLDGKHQGYAFMLRKIAEKGFICSVVHYLQKNIAFLSSGTTANGGEWRFPC